MCESTRVVDSLCDRSPIFGCKELIFVLPNQLAASQLVEVLVVLPKLDILAFALIASHLVEDT